MLRAFQCVIRSGPRQAYSLTTIILTYNLVYSFLVKVLVHSRALMTMQMWQGEPAVVALWVTCADGSTTVTANF